MSERIILSVLFLCLTSLSSLADDKEPTLNFEAQEIDNKLGIGYAVRIVDVDDDGRKDIVVVDQARVVWYKNPTWKQFIIIEGQTTPDNVCIAAGDADGDGKVDFALGAGWANLKANVPGPLYWIQRGKSLNEKWNVYPIGSEISVHRIRFADIDGDRKDELIVAPLLGKGTSRKNNFMETPVRFQALHVPKDPTKDRWTPEIIDASLHVMHNFWKVPSQDSAKQQDLISASYEGVHLHHRLKDGKWTRTKLGAGNQENPKSNRGASEIKVGQLSKSSKGFDYVATIEPWHGNQVVVYLPPVDEPKKKIISLLWERSVLDANLRWGHGVWCADLTGDGKQELIIGVRDNKSKKTGEQSGVRIYRALDQRGSQWKRTLVDEGGVAVEDLAADDLNGDGRIDVVAVGRQTKNVRIYWNRE